MPGYTDLAVTPICTGIAADNTTFTVDDGTGTYPASEGGFAESGSGTATRPSLDQVIICFMYRFLPFSDDELQRYPNPQPALPATFSNLSGAADRVVQVVELVLPDSYNWATLLAEDNGWEELITLAQESGAVGQLPVWMDVNESNCVYDALRRLNNTFPANCSQEEWKEKNAMFVGTAAELSLLIPSLVPNVPTTEAGYTEAQAQIDELVALCNNPNCNC